MCLLIGDVSADAGITINVIGQKEPVGGPAKGSVLEIVVLGIIIVVGLPGIIEDDGSERKRGSLEIARGCDLQQNMVPGTIFLVLRIVIPALKKPVVVIAKTVAGECA